MKLKYEFEIMDLDDQIIAVPIGDGASELHGVIKMNGSASKVFQLLKEEVKESEIIKRLIVEYNDSPEAQIREYVHSIILLFKEKGIIVES